MGQRRGLGIAAGEPLYVIATDPQTQRVMVGGNDDLLRGRFFAREVNWISIAGVDAPVRAQVKIRNKHAAAPRHALHPRPTPRASRWFSTTRNAPLPPARARFSMTATWCWAAAGSSNQVTVYSPTPPRLPH